MIKPMILIGLLLTVVLACGCLSVSQYTTVQKDGNISDVKLVMNTTSYVYGLLNTSSSGEGQTSFQDSMSTNLSKEFSGVSASDITYSQVQSGGYVIMTWEAKGTLTPKADSGVTITKNGSDITYMYRSVSTSPTSQYTSGSGNLSGMSSAMLNGLEFDYYVTMPGKIIDTNANVTNGDMAEWKFNGSTMADMGYMYAKSDTTASSPGFESIIAIAGIVTGGYFIALARKKE